METIAPPRPNPRTAAHPGQENDDQEKLAQLPTDPPFPPFPPVQTSGRRQRGHRSKSSQIKVNQATLPFVCHRFVCRIPDAGARFTESRPALRARCPKRPDQGKSSQIKAHPRPRPRPLPLVSIVRLTLRAHGGLHCGVGAELPTSGRDRAECLRKLMHPS